MDGTISGAIRLTVLSGGAVLHDLIRRSRLGDDAQVRQDGSTDWITAAQALPSLPPLQEATPTAAGGETASPARGPLFDSTVPGASTVYAPPQATLTDAPLEEFSPPKFLHVSVAMLTGASVVNVLLTLLTLNIHVSSFGSEPLPNWMLTASEIISPEDGLGLLAIAALAQILSLVIWQGCAFRSLRRLYGDMVRRSAFSGLWWFVPIAGLFMPLFCLRHLRYLSRKRQHFLDPRPSFGPLLVWLEIVILADLPFTTMWAVKNFHASRGGDVGENWAPSTLESALDLLTDCKEVAFSILLLAIVLTNWRQQKELFRHWRNNAFWALR